MYRFYPIFQDEIVGVLDLVEKVLNKFSFIKFDVMLATRPAKSVGSDENWAKATTALQVCVRVCRPASREFRVGTRCGAQG